jgi:broad specificity phosphatase PhoE
LTDRGRAQALLIGEFVRRRHPAPLLVGHEVPQVLETTRLLADALGSSYALDERLRGLNLGTLAGLSRDEALRLHPAAADRLEAWRKGLQPIDTLDLPGAEPIGIFERRVRAAFGEWSTKPGELLVLVLTRSTLIMILNILSLGEQFSYSAYRPYEFSSGGITEVRSARGALSLLTLNSVEHIH